MTGADVEDRFCPAGVVTWAAASSIKTAANRSETAFFRVIEGLLSERNGGLVCGAPGQWITDLLRHETQPLSCIGNVQGQLDLPLL